MTISIRQFMVIPALLRRFHEAAQSHAPEVVVWGSGTPMREFRTLTIWRRASIHVGWSWRAKRGRRTSPDAVAH